MNWQNELMTAVEHGDISKAEKLMKEDISFDSKIPDRIPNDPLRSEKNLAFTYNTTTTNCRRKRWIASSIHP